MNSSKVQWCPTIYVVRIDTCAVLYQKFNDLVVSWTNEEEMDNKFSWSTSENFNLEYRFYHVEKLLELVSNSCCPQYGHSRRAVTKLQQLFYCLNQRKYLHESSILISILFECYLLSWQWKVVCILEKFEHQWMHLYPEAVPPNVRGLDCKRSKSKKIERQ